MKKSNSKIKKKNKEILIEEMLNEKRKKYLKEIDEEIKKIEERLKNLYQLKLAIKQD